MESQQANAIEAAGAEFLAECARVGFGVRELGAVLISDSAGHRFADAMAVLRALPSGAGFQAFFLWVCCRRALQLSSRR